MVLGSTYTDQQCTLARSLEVIGERWTLLIVRDAFYGVRHFGDFISHLGIPRAVLSDRLSTLVDGGVLDRVGSGRRTEYELTAKGVTLWPVVLSLMVWGSAHYAPRGPNRLFVHVDDGGVVDAVGRCPVCVDVVAPAELEVRPGPGLDPDRTDDDPVEARLRIPHRLLEPLVAEPG